MQIKTTKDYIIEGKLLLKGTILTIDESRLIEMAKSWNDIKKDLSNELVVREKHLIKLYYYKGQNFYDNNFRGWIDSIKKGFEHLAKDSKTNKFPKADKIYDVIWLSVKDSFDEFHAKFIEDLNEEYKDFRIITDVDYEGVRNFVENFNKWASEMLAKNGSINTTETARKVKELLNL